jgi:hypothetical protein
MLHACYLLFILCLCMSVKGSTELMLYVVLTMPTLIYLLFIYLKIGQREITNWELFRMKSQLISKVSSAKSLTFTGIQARHYFINVSWKGLNFWEKQEYWSDVQGIALLFTILLGFFTITNPSYFIFSITNKQQKQNSSLFQTLEFCPWYINFKE